MPIFCPGPVGRAIALPDEGAAGTMTLIELDPILAWWSHQSIITRMTIGLQGNYQFLHTIGNDVYIYVFGDRIGQISISGLSMAVDCDGGGPPHGFELVLDWYAENRVAKRKTPVTVTIGDTSIEGFVIALNGDAVDAQTHMVQYNLTLAVMPEKL